MIAESKPNLAAVLERRKAERLKALDDYADRQADGFEIDPEELADALEAADIEHHDYLARVDERSALRRCREQIAAALTAETKITGLDKKLASINDAEAKAQAEAQAARRPLIHEREQLIAIIHAGTSARSEIHRIAPASHKQAVAALHAKHKQANVDRDKAQRAADHCRGQLQSANLSDRPGIERMHPDARRSLEQAVARHEAAIAEADKVKREIEEQIAALDKALYEGAKS